MLEVLLEKSISPSGPETGSARCIRKASSLGPKILISCFWRSHALPIFGPKELVVVLVRRNMCIRPVISPDRFKTTVAIIDVLKSPPEIT